MAKKSYSIYLNEDNVAKAQGGLVAREPYSGNLSGFLDDLLTAAVSDAPPPLNKTSGVLVELARQFHPTIADELAAAAKAGNLNERRALMRALDAIIDGLSRGVDLAKPFAIFNSEEQMLGFLKAQPTARALIERMRDLAQGFALEGGLLGEDPGEYHVSVSGKPKETKRGKPPRESAKKIATDLAAIATEEIEAELRRRRAQKSAATH